MKLSALGVLLVCLVMITASAISAPQMLLPETNFDFGFVPQKSKISHTFWIKSVGDDDLKILKVIPGCGCTKAPLEKNVIIPGDSTRLEIIFSTKQYKSLVSKRPKIQSNEGSGDKSVMFKAHVVPNPASTYPLVLDPFIVNFSQTKVNDDNSITVNIKNVTKEDLEIILIDKAGENFYLKLPKIIKAGKIAQASIRLNNELGALSFEKSFTIEVNDKNKSRFTIPVKQNVRLTKK